MKNVKRIYKALLTVALMAAVIVLLPLSAKADGLKVKVVVDGAYIRDRAGTGGAVVSSVVKDNVLEVITTETDSNGSTWYKVWVDSEKTGYIRSDLVKSVDGSDTTTNNSNTSTDTTNGNGNTTTDTTTGNNNTSTDTTTGNGNTTTTTTSTTKGKVLYGANVRASAGTDSKVVASVTQNSEIDIISKETGTDGNVWYKIAVNATTYGYVRSDMVSVNGEVTSATSGNTSTTTSDNNSSSTTTKTEPEVTPVEPTKPTTETTTESALVEINPIEGKTTQSVNMRKGPSTSTDKVTVVDGGMAVMVYGYAKDESHTWYYVTYNSETTGYIRDDFMALNGDIVEKTDDVVVNPEPEIESQPEPEPEPVYCDYEVTYELDENGDAVWYLKDYTEGTKNPVLELIDAKKDLEQAKTDYEKDIKKKKIGNIILIVLLALVIVGSAAGFVFMRRWYMGYDETEEPVSRPSKDRYSEPAVRTSSRTTSTSRPVSTEARTSSRTTGDYDVKVSGAKTTSSSSASSSRGVMIDDEHMQMPDGTIKRAVVGTRQADGSIKLKDGRVRLPDGTIINPESTASHSAANAPIFRGTQASAPNYGTSDDDDMEYGFLNITSDADEE
ncbi:MAG: SH3 domain-containing protein [Lachnospiraceae bacterium]|nr:SH3 domain-containing protein [Lachnospiraceae bacterium]